MALIHSEAACPNIFPVENTAGKSEIDRLQELSASITLNRTKIEELGRNTAVCWRTGVPSVSLSMRQLEYGQMEIYRRLSNLLDAATTVNLSDFKNSFFDIALYKTDDDGTYQGTVYYPAQRMESFSVSIGDPDALIERNFSTIGEDEIEWQNDNKYYIELIDTSCTGAGHQIVIGSGGWADYPAPVYDPNVSGQYFVRGYSVTGAGVNTELTEGTDFTYSNLTQTITIAASVSGTTYKFWYTATTYIVGEEPFVDNDIDLCSIGAEDCEIYLGTSDRLYKLQSVTLDVSFDRNDYKEIGNENIVQRGVREITTTVTLGRILEDYTLEEYMIGQSGTDYGKIDVREFGDGYTLICKIYNNADHDTFKMRYDMTNLSPTSLEGAASINEYLTMGVTLTGDAGTIKSVDA